MALSVIILAAGKGTRMRSVVPKVLHRLAGKPLVEHVIQTASELEPRAMHLVYGHGAELVEAQLAHLDIDWVLQDQQLGTGHAVQQALPAIPDADTVLILYGDVPLVAGDTLAVLVAQASRGALALLTVELDEPSGYGRVVRDGSGTVVAIIEEKDATAAQKGIHEINTGIMAAPAAPLKDWIGRLENANAQGEYYLTDIVAMAVTAGVPVTTASPQSMEEVLGVNDRVQLAQLERHYQRMQAEELMRAGVTLRDPQRFDLRGRLSHGLDVEIDANVLLEGNVRLGSHVRIGPNCIIRDSDIADGAVVLANSLIEGAVVGAHSRIGPFARLRPEAYLAQHVHIGNFVEVKKADIGAHSKANHLTYIGDATIGAHVNVGAGTITCNYDGANKHRTVIGDDVFVGSNTALVAPLTVGDGATVGAGSTLNLDVPAGKLALARARQVTIESWARPRKK